MIPDMTPFGQQREISALKARVATLEERLAQLEARLDGGVVPVEHVLSDPPEEDPSVTKEGETDAEPVEVPEWVYPTDASRPLRQLPKLD